MANAAKSTKNKRKAPVQNGTYNKKKRTVDERIANKGSQNEESIKIEGNFKNKMIEKFEEELKCNICTEILIKPTVLNCSHTFCEFCIIKWKKQQERCPICRDKIESQIRVLALDVYIEKALELLSPEQMKAREEIINYREKHSCPKPRRSQRLRNRASFVNVTSTHVTIEEGFHLRALFDEILNITNNFISD